LFLLLRVFAVARFCCHPERSEGPRYHPPHPYRAHLSTQTFLPALQDQSADLIPDPSALIPVFPCQAPKRPKNEKSPTKTRRFKFSKGGVKGLSHLL
jgi:hypothetical protein